MGAVLAKGNRILGWGVNNGRHCEVSAICDFKRLKGSLEGTQLYVARVSAVKKNIGLAKPCPDCRKFIEMFQIDEVWYTDPCAPIKQQVVTWSCDELGIRMLT